jgi:D-alanine-D-alanine ligase
MNIGVFFGSRAPEHDISIVTGELVISGLKKLGHTVIPVYIDKKGQWLIGDDLGSIKVFTEGNADKVKGLGEYQIDLKKSNGKLVFKKKGPLGKQVTVDLAFPAFHGSYGEDGTIQGLFEIFDVPYVGCDTTCSAITMDKVLTKLCFDSFGFPTPKFTSVSQEEWANNKETTLNSITEMLQYPLFIKPSRLGSSIGISKAKNKKELEFALEVALHYDTRALVEEGVENLMDITCCVIGNESPTASLLQESAFSKDFFSYEDKYLNDGGAQLGNATKNLIIPARLDEKTTKEIRDLAIDIYKKMGCSGISRVDFLYNKKTGKYYTTEINTMPGTVYHHLWKETGVELNELLTKLIHYAQEKYEAKKKITLTFESDILKMANSVKLNLKK